MNSTPVPPTAPSDLVVVEVSTVPGVVDLAQCRADVNDDLEAPSEANPALTEMARADDLASYSRAAAAVELGRVHRDEVCAIVESGPISAGGPPPLGALTVDPWRPTRTVVGLDRATTFYVVEPTNGGAVHGALCQAFVEAGRGYGVAVAAQAYPLSETLVDLDFDPARVVSGDQVRAAYLAYRSLSGATDPNAAPWGV